MRYKIIITFFLLVSLSFAQFQEDNFNQKTKKAESIIELFKVPKFDSRRITGLVYSTFVPGSGQIYLGSKTKGSLFALGFFTGVVGTAVSQNNFIGNRERIESLKFEYLNADRFTQAEYYWKQMVDVHNEQKMHERARDIFIVSTVILWAFNLIDYIFLTQDKGPIEFSSNNSIPTNSITIVNISLNLR